MAKRVASSSEGNALANEEEEVQSTESTSRHVQGMSSGIRGLASRYNFIVYIGLFLPVGIVAVIARLDSDLLIHITGLVVIFFVVCFSNQQNWQKNLRESIFVLLVLVLTSSSLGLVPEILALDKRFRALYIIISSRFGPFVIICRILLASLVLFCTVKVLAIRNGAPFSSAEMAIESVVPALRRLQFSSKYQAIPEVKSAGLVKGRHSPAEAIEQILVPEPNSNLSEAEEAWLNDLSIQNTAENSALGDEGRYLQQPRPRLSPVADPGISEGKQPLHQLFTQSTAENSASADKGTTGPRRIRFRRRLLHLEPVPIAKNASSPYSHVETSEDTIITEYLDNILSSSSATWATSEKITHARENGTSADKEEKKINNEATLGISIDIDLEEKEYMRECLHYCSLFPADFEFSRDTLIWSWIAAGLINAEQSGVMEAVASRCFDKLIRLKYILESGYDHSSDQMKYKLERYKLLFLDKQPLDLKYRKMLDNDTDMAKVEHLSLISEQIDQIQLDSIQKCTRLKTLLLHKCWGSKFQSLLHDLFLELKFLTNLDLSGTNIDELPNSIENLTMLRYLDMSGTPIRQLPESIDSLGCLETLILLQCLRLCSLPKCTYKLVNLQHLVLDLAQLLQSMPTRVGKLMNLQTLRAFVVGKKDGNRIAELRNLNKLKGSICLMKLENILNAEEARKAHLCDKQYLSKLEFIWSDVLDAKDTTEEEILEYLKPHFGLEELKIVSYSGSVLPSWISNPFFTQMASITLYRCRYCERLSSLGELPSLKALNIVDMDEVVGIDKLFCQKHASQDPQAFPKLERLSLEGMSNLVTWTGVEDGNFPRLQQLFIKYCPKLAALPTFSYFISLQHLEVCDCPVLSCLPEGGLPASLLCFMLEDCPKLKERCCKEQGEDWDKVASVPTLYIDHRKIESSR